MACNFEVIPFMEDLWVVYENLSKLQEKHNSNSQALILFWHAAVQDCPEVATATLRSANRGRIDMLISYFITYVLYFLFLGGCSKTKSGILKSLTSRSLFLNLTEPFSILRL